MLDDARSNQTLNFTGIDWVEANWEVGSKNANVMMGTRRLLVIFGNTLVPTICIHAGGGLLVSFVWDFGFDAKLPKLLTDSSYIVFICPVVCIYANDFCF